MQDLGHTVSVPTHPRTDISVLGARTYEKTGARDLERDGWWRALSAAIAMIKWANMRIENAERTIDDLQTRIAKLEQQVTLDELTGIMNRRGFFDAFTREMDRTTRGHSAGGLLIMIDLDNFKAINDTHGHAAGDAALRLVAKTLLGNSRTMDVCGRLGGDEFVLLLVNAQRDKVLVRAQNLIKQLNSLTLVWHGAEIPVRASLGLKEYSGGEKIEDIMGDADGKLYIEKRNNKGFTTRAITAAE